MSKVTHGACLCQGVRFEIKPPFMRESHHHCDGTEVSLRMGSFHSVTISLSTLLFK
jgi:hypothetical protein